MKADNENIIDLVVSTINIIQPGDSLVVAGNSFFQGDVTIDGTLTTSGGGGGTTPINIGVGDGVFKQVSGSNSEFKSLLEGTGISITNLANELRFDIDATASEITNVPSGTIISTNVQGAINELESDAHTQNTDTSLDTGGSNPTTALELRQHLDQYLELLDGSGGLTIPLTDVDIPFDTQIHINSNYSHTGGSAEITFNVAGTYNIIYKATTEITSGVFRTNVEFRLQLDTGGGYIDVDRSKSNTQNRTTGSGPSTTFSTNIITVSATDKIKLTAIKLLGTSTVETVLDETNIIIFKLN